MIADATETARMAAHIERLVDKDLTGKVIGGFFAVYNSLDYGFLENVYSSALSLELRGRGLMVQRELPVEVLCEGQPVALYRADMVVENRLLIEIKSKANLIESDRRQLLNYLRATALEAGLLFHFGPNPAFYRAISTRKHFEASS